MSRMVGMETPMRDEEKKKRKKAEKNEGTTRRSSRVGREEQPLWISSPAPRDFSYIPELCKIVRGMSQVAERT